MSNLLLFAISTLVMIFSADKPVTTEVVLLENGAAQNAIVVTTEGGSVTIDTPYEATRLGAAETAPESPKAVSKEALAAAHPDTFGIAAPKPLVYTLYFRHDSPQLTETSRREFKSITAAIRSRGPSHIDISGYTDRAGSVAHNRTLSLKRAEQIKTLLESRAVASLQYHLYHYGERLPAVPTPDGVNEPKNRRVEVLVR